MNKKIRLLIFTVIFLISSTACLALSGNSEGNSNANLNQVPSQAPKPAGLITDVVLALNVVGDDYQPVDVTDEFGPSDTIHAVVSVKNAPDETRFTAKWFTTDVGEADVPNKLIDLAEVTAGGSGNLDFSLEPDSNFPAGTYRVEIYINDKLDQTYPFTIINNGTDSNSAAPVESYIVKVTMARGVEGVEKNPINPTSTFKPSDTVHAVIQVDGAPSNTNYTAIWLVTDIGNVAEPDTIIDKTTLAMSGSANIDFSLEPTNPFPLGKYRVEIQTEGTTFRVEEYEVR